MAEHSMLDRQIKTALDETRLLILGSQILLGFQFSGTFQQGFDGFDPLARNLHAAGLLLMVFSATFLIAPSVEHRIVEHGFANRRIIRVAGMMAATALISFALSLGIDIFTLFRRIFGPVTGAVCGASFVALAFLFWFAWEYAMRRIPKKDNKMPRAQIRYDTPISDRVEHMLTEARVVLPGAQALLGFQFQVILTRAFDALPEALKTLHAGALCLVALSVILLIAPASFHRITFGGDENEAFHRFGSRLVIAATLPLSAGTVADLYIAVWRASGPRMALGAALAAAAVLMFFWYIRPLILRARLSPQQRART